MFFCSRLNNDCEKCVPFIKARGGGGMCEEGVGWVGIRTIFVRQRGGTMKLSRFLNFYMICWPFEWITCWLGILIGLVIIRNVTHFQED